VGSTITFSGFNDIDFNTVLNALMDQASQPLTALQTQQSALQSQVTTYGTLTSQVATLQSAAQDLADLSTTSSFTAQSSAPSAVSVSTTGTAVGGDYDVIVNDLARAQVTASTSVSSDASTTVVASGGSLTIGGVTVAVAGDVTLQGLADAINGTDGIGVRAAVIQTGTDAYRLTLTGSLSGQANGFTVTNGLTGGTGVTFADTDGNGISGDSAEDNAVNASDASLLVNNIAVTGSSNTFTNVIPGVTFTAYAKDPNTTVHIGVTSDSSAFAAKLDAFVKSYNDIASFINDQRTSAAQGDASSIGRDALLRQLSGSLRSTLLGAHGSDALTRLSEIGVEFQRDGTLSLDTNTLTTALANNESDVRDLLSGTDGAFTAVSGVLDSYSQAGGFLSTATDTLTRQIKSMDQQIQDMQARLAQQRDSLQQQFTQADLAMSQLKSQTSSLSSFGANLGSSL
jgi:flagellar hook-associated protein 2